MCVEQISVTVLTKNSEKHLEKVLFALRDFGEVLIMDSGSTDKTLSIARSFSNTRIKTTTFDGFGPVHNRAVQLAKYDWILSVDSDEIVSKELVNEIHSLQLCKDTIYAINRKNFYNNKWIQGCGWWPDRVLRLFHRKKTSFSNDAVHESVQTKEINTCYLRHCLIHYSYENTSDFLEKMQTYSSLWAQQNKGKKCSFSRSIIHAIWAFFRSYILQKGFLDGKEGLLISIYNANTTFYKYLKLLNI